MDCTTAWKWMMQALDGALPAQRERDLWIHVGNCKTCRETWDNLTEASVLLPELSLLEPVPEDAWSRILSRLPSTAPVPGGPEGKMLRPSCRLHPYIWTACAGLLFGILLPVFFIMLQSDVSSLLRVFGRFVGWVVSGFEGLIQLLTAVLGPEWTNVATWLVPVVATVLLMSLSLALARQDLKETGHVWNTERSRQ